MTREELLEKTASIYKLNKQQVIEIYGRKRENSKSVAADYGIGHLYVERIWDGRVHGEWLKGLRRRPAACLTEEQVVEIYFKYRKESCITVAAQYGISSPKVTSIWKKGVRKYSSWLRDLDNGYDSYRAQLKQDVFFVLRNPNKPATELERHCRLTISTIKQIRKGKLHKKLILEFEKENKEVGQTLEAS